VQIGRVFSPWSIAYVAEMLLLGSAGGTREALAEKLGQGGPGDVSAPCLAAGAGWLDVAARPSQEFLGACARRGICVERCRLADRASGEAISAWITEHTKGLFRPKVELGADALACLVSAIYFKDAWDVPFDPELTAEGEFRLESGKVTDVQLMAVSEELAVVDYPAASVTARTFASGARMVFALPREGVPVDSLLEGAALEAMEDYLAPRRRHREMVYLKVPEFDFASSYSGLERELMGGTDCDLTPMVGDRPALLQVVHEAKVVVNEEGAEAAAYTMAVTLGCAGPREPREFVLDRPFVFAIVSAEGELLFMGAVRG
jgi:serpin B